MKTLRDLINTLPRSGKVTWIGVRPQRRAKMVALEKVTATPEDGLVGDRYHARSTKRQVTLLQAEHLPAIASYLGRERVTPVELRRNLLIEGINLLALKNTIIAVDDVQLEITPDNT